VQTFKESVFFEIKALQQKTIPPSTSTHQVTGYLDVMRRAPSAQAGVPPALYFLTTGDVKGVGFKTRLRATSRRIWLEPQLGSTLQIGSSLVQNPELFFLTGVLYIPSSPGTAGNLPVRP
jgi:hypothetical protein